MGDSILSRFSNAWNAFFVGDNKTFPFFEEGYGSTHRPNRRFTSYSSSDRSITASVLNRMAIDVSILKVRHVKVNKDDRYLSTMNSGLNECLSIAANIDQTYDAFFLDATMSLFEEGVIAIVPVDTSKDPTNSEGYDIHSLRVGEIKQWYPNYVRVNLYNDRKGIHEEIELPKKMVAIVENPFYSVMNEQNSTLKRLVRKLNMLDVVDEASNSGKLDLIIQLPYVIKSESRKKQAAERRQDIVDQLKSSEYGIAYTDGTEKVIQLNRPAENNLMTQIEYLTSMLYSQLGITSSIMDGTADEKTMLNYYKRTIEPVSDAIINSMYRSFISRTAKTQGQKIMVFSDLFKLVPMIELADMSDKFTRNEILSSNEIRAILGMPPSTDPSADELRNKNLNKSNDVTEKGGSDIDEEI